ncbi:MAG: arginine repressor [Oscillospiraceae bacterium]|jgi:transcriptional regulator of arginine metabolism|nr:arginine repressor [Oscillospiraceae bacterium]
MKSRRQELILQAIKDGKITTQEQLLDYLLRCGVNATQATVSRDMKDLGLRKVKRGGKTYYEAAGPTESMPMHDRAMFLRAVRGVDGAGNIACVRCGAGMAQAVCAALDAAPSLPGVVGSLAGEDTIFLLCRSEEDMHSVRAMLARFAAREADDASEFDD